MDPGWASFLGQPGAIGCHASGVGEWTAGNAGAFAVDVRRGVLVLVLGPMGVGRGEAAIRVRVPPFGLSTSTSTNGKGQWGQIYPFDKSTARLGTQRIDWVGVWRLIPMIGSRQDGQDEQDGSGPRGGVGRGPEAPRWEHRRIPGRGCEGVCQALELVRPPSCPRPVTSVSGSESESASSRSVVRFRFR